MPRKQQGWITFQSSESERQLLEQYCQQTQRSKTEILRELLRSLAAQNKLQSDSSSSSTEILDLNAHKPDTALQTLQVSARNLLKGKVKRLIRGAVSTEVVVEIAPGVDLVSVITTASANQLDLSEGKEVFAMIKSSNVMIATFAQT